MAETYGWAGKILRVNLTTGEITTQDDEKYHKYIGGMGMAYRIMYEEAPMDLDPYDEKAQVIFGVGPLTGAGVPCSGRMNVTFRTGDAGLDAAFVAGAAEHQIQNVKGHRLVGGMRASVYNAVTMEDVQALATYMKDFEAQHSLSPRSN